jgi:integrase
MSEQIYASIIKRKRRVGRRIVTSVTWHLRYRLPGEPGFTVMSLGVRDRQVAEARRMDWLREREREQQGILPPLALREAAVRPTTEHVTDFASDLHARRRSAKYCYNVEKRLAKLVTGCEWHLLRDVTADSFTVWRARQSTPAAKTLNEYLDAANALLNWLQRQGKLIANPLGSVGKVETAGNQRRCRRAISADQFSRLLSVAGPRRVVYLAAVLTGLRRSELAKLLWSDVHLDAARPFLTARAATTKNRKAATIFLRDDLAAEMRVLSSEAAVTDPVFSPLMPSMDEFRADLAAADLAYLDKSGRRFDFHALRHTLATWLHACGVPQRQAMEVMRHSDARLTNTVYADAALLPAIDALERLPHFESVPAVLSATGTDGTHAGTHGSGTGCPSPSLGVTVAPESRHSISSVKSESKRDSDVKSQPCHREDESSAGRIRTYNSPRKNKPSSHDGTHGGTHDGTHASTADRNLAELISAWPTLAPSIRAAVLAVVRSSGSPGINADAPG